MAEHIDELERRINDLVTTEKRVIKNQQREDFFHRDMIDKINRLDKRLKDYLSHHKERELRFKALEQKVYDTLSKDQRLLGLQAKVKGLEILYKEVVASKREAGGNWAYAIEPGQDHYGDLKPSDDLIRTFFTSVIKQRIHPDTNALIVIPQSSGWLGNNNSKLYAPYESYNENKSDASWLIDEAFANKWKNFQQ